MSSIELLKAGITDVPADCVVNAANNGLWQGGGVCGVIFRAAGPQELTKACQAIGHCPTGSAVITPAFALKGAQYIIHAVGPVWQDGNHGEPAQLFDAYKTSLELCRTHGCHSIVFPLISAGIFGCPKQTAWRKALQSCQRYLQKYPEWDVAIRFAVPDDSVRAIGAQEYQTLFPNGMQDTLAKPDSWSTRRAKRAAVFQDTCQQIRSTPALSHPSSRLTEETVLYPDHFRSERRVVKQETGVLAVTPESTLSAAEFADGKVAVLNFANAYTPGGGVLEGSAAQEESLCRSSNLYEALSSKKCRDLYYDFNRKQVDHHGTDALLYTPNVTFFKDDMPLPNAMPEEDWYQADVITCAAPENFARHPISDRIMEQLHLSRGRNILEVAMARDVDTLVLGAFGCGAFSNDPAIVAQVYRKLLLEEGYLRYFRKVIFAILPDSGENVNLRTFYRTLLGKEYPRAALRTDWKILPTPEALAEFTLHYPLSPAQRFHIFQGFVPKEMEEHWFTFAEGDTVYFYRSWSGFFRYSVTFTDGSDQLLVRVNRDPEQYENTSLARDRREVCSLLDSFSY